ncbi:MAG: VWA domain-containing protein [Acidobacteriota bacterium]
MKPSAIARPFFAVLIILLVCAQLAAQSPRKREKFGSSLKRLKWDEARKTAVETQKKKSDKTNSKRDEEPIRLETLFVSMDVTVSDSSRFVTGLAKDDFILTEDGQPQQIASFAKGDDARLPRSIILVIDYSGSQLPYLQSSVSAARALIDKLAPADEMAIVTDDIELLIHFTKDKTRLKAALDHLLKQATANKGEDLFGRFRAARRGKTLQFSALFAALRELVRDDARTIIIFQTDGDEAFTFRDQPEADDYLWNMPRREYGLADIYAAAARSRATIYSLIVGERLSGLPTEQLYEQGRRMLARVERARYASDEEYLRHARIFPLTDAKVKLLTDRFLRAQEATARVAELTGGWSAFFERSEQAAQLYERILDDIFNRYVIGYYPANVARDGRFRRVKIEVRGHPEYTVHGRAGYFAPDR